MYNNKWLKLYFQFTIFVSFILLNTSVFTQDLRIDPPNWWVGMKHNVVELMVYGENIADYKLNITSKDIFLAGTSRFDNPNYVFVRLEITDNAKPQDLELLFFKRKERIKVIFPVLAREENEFRRKGLKKGDLIYLIMPDRFANGDATNDTISGMLENNIDRSNLKARHGGDLRGIIDRLDYIENLGITALWLNPVFTNNQPKESYHGYAITDHYQIDPRFGTLEEYTELVDKCHSRGIKVVMDIVHNHVGDEHFFIKDLPHDKWIHTFEEYTRTNYRAPALHDPYASDFDRNLLINGWFDRHMPDLDQTQEQVANYLIQNQLWWVEKTKIDGYRIDTYAYPDQEFMAEWAKIIKEEYPHLGLFGEIWDHGVGVQSWFVENSAKKELNSNLSGVTDFQIHFAIQEALTKEQTWTEGVSKLYYTLAQDYLYDDPFNNVNFLDNHDVSRIFSVLGEDTDKMKTAMTLLLTLRGIPQIYYGTEILMKNYTDPHDGYVREDFPGGWPGDTINKFDVNNLNEKEKDFFNHTRTLATYRKNNSVMQDGAFKHFVPEDGIYAYFRSKSNYRVMVLSNFNAESKKVSLLKYQEMFEPFGSMKNILTGEIISNLQGEIELKPFTALVLELVPQEGKKK